jgi:hypothetical protein
LIRNEPASQKAANPRRRANIAPQLAAAFSWSPFQLAGNNMDIADFHARRRFAEIASARSDAALSST